MSLSVLGEDRMTGRSDASREDVRPRGEPQTIGLKDLYFILRRRLSLMAFIVIFGTLLSVVAAIQIPKVYTARSTILLKPDDPNLLEGAAQQTATQPNASRMDTETDLMTSRIFAGRVVDELNLIADPRFNTFLGDDGDESKPAISGLSFSDTLLGAVGGLKNFVLGSLGKGEGALPDSATQRDQAVTVFLSKLTISRSGESNAMTVAVSDGDPGMAASIANVVTNLYAEWSRDLKQDSTRDAVEFLRQQAGGLALRISTLETEIAEYSRNENVSSDPRDDLLRAKMQQANEQLGVARVELAQAQSLLDQARRGTEANEMSALLASQFLTSLRENEATAVRERAQISRNLGANHPLMMEADARIASIRKMTSAEMERIVLNLEGDLRVAEGRVNKIESDLAISQEALRRRADAEIRLRELNRDLLTEQQLYDVVSGRLGKLDPYAEIAKPNARVISLAATPSNPSFPQNHIMVAGGFVGSLLLAFVAAIGLENLDTRVRNSKRVSSLFQAPVLALVPKLPRRRWSRALDVFAETSLQPNSALAESFRSIYGACKRARMGRQGQVILITSALPLEGKTSVAIGLAVAAASAGVRTLLVDLDLRTGGLGASMRPGAGVRRLNDYLDGLCGLREVVEPVQGMVMLDVVRSSTIAGHMGRVLDSDRLVELVEMFRSEYDIVVVDSPPLLVVEDATAIAALVDAIILVAAWARTTEEALSAAGERLRQAAVPVIGIVLNCVDSTSQGSGLPRGARARRRQIGRYFTMGH